jgi:hypothetical protein
MAAAQSLALPSSTQAGKSCWLHFPAVDERFLYPLPMPEIAIFSC